MADFDLMTYAVGKTSNGATTLTLFGPTGYTTLEMNEAAVLQLIGMLTAAIQESNNEE